MYTNNNPNPTREDLIRRHSNYRLFFMNDDELREELKRWCREDLILWLQWNDGNGIYDDKSSLAELGRIMTYEEGIELVMKNVAESRDESAPQA